MSTISGDNFSTSEIVIGPGDILRFDPNASTKLSTTRNVNILGGAIEMKPANSSVKHDLVFTGVDEEAYVGAPLPTQGVPPSMTPVASDIGLWVMGASIADIVGTAKVAWNRTGSDPSWSASDEMVRAPWAPNDFTTFAPHVLGTTPLSIVDPYEGLTHTQEVFNFTRNVRIGGTPGHKAHALFMTTGTPPNVDYVDFQHTGPRKATGDSLISANVRGRWAGLHLHHLGNTAYGKTYRGNVARDGGSHAHVMHHSHGITFDDFIGYNLPEDVYWWDREVLDDLTHDAVYNHCAAAKLIPIPVNRGIQLCGFNLSNDGGSVFNSVVVGNMGGTNSAGYIWPEKAGPDIKNGPPVGLWANLGNVAHNNKHLATFVWHNNALHHLIQDMTAFRNGEGCSLNGAYINGYHYEDIRSWDSGEFDFEFLALGHTGAGSLGQRWTNVMGQKAVIRDHHVASSLPGVAQNSLFGHMTVDEPTVGLEAGLYDFIRTDLDTDDWTFLRMHPNSVYRVQRDDNTAYQVVAPGTFADIAPFALYVSTPSLPSGTTGVAYSQQLAAALPSGAVTWRLKTGSGPLPSGFTLSAGGLISGTSAVVATSPFTVEAVDAAGNIAPKALSIQIVSSGTPLQITTTSLAGGFVGSVYSDAVLATGGTVPRTFGLVAGALPAGLSLSSAGAITGTSTNVQFATFTVRVTDNVGAFDDQVLSINVVNLNPSVKKTTPPPGEVGLLYSHQFVATGGTPGYTFASILGPLPPGMALGASGLLNGTPAAAGVYPIRIQTTDSLGRTGVRDFTITIHAPLKLVIPAVPIAFVGQAFLMTLLATDGAPPYSFTVRGGEENFLPVGMTLSLDGVLSGVPLSSPGLFAFTVDVFDGAGAQVSVDIVLDVQHAQVITTWLPDTDVSTTWAPDADVTTAWST